MTAQDQARQKTPFWTDLKRRPGFYAHDIKDSAALKFSLGNLAYALFLLLQTGLNAGSGAAMIFQGFVTAYTGKKQLDATYKGRAFDAPYKVNGWANTLTAAFIAATGVMSYIPDHNNKQPAQQNAQAVSTPATTQQDDDVWSRMIFPTLTFGFWAAAHFSFGAAANRRKTLKRQGLTDEQITSDRTVGKNVARGEVVSGIADVAAIFKDKSLIEASRMLGNPTAPQNLNSLVGAPFFVYGFYKSLVRNENTAKEKPVEHRLPNCVRRILHIENQELTPVHYYAGGYLATAALTTVSAISNPLQWPFALASTVWGIGYHDMTREHTTPPQSADEYAIETGVLPAPPR